MPAPSCEATQPPTPITRSGFCALSARTRPRSWNTRSCAFSRTEHVLNRMTSASSARSVSVRPSDASSTSAMRSESYSFIWHPNVRMKSFLGKAAGPRGGWLFRGGTVVAGKTRSIAPLRGPVGFKGRPEEPTAPLGGSERRLCFCRERGGRYLPTRGPIILARSTTICLACAGVLAPPTDTRSWTRGLSKSANRRHRGRPACCRRSRPRRCPGIVSTLRSGCSFFIVASHARTVVAGVALLEVHADLQVAAGLLRTRSTSRSSASSRP